MAESTVHLLAASVRSNRLLWLLAFVPLPLIGHAVMPEAQTLVFALSVVAIIPLAALLSLATESVAERTGDAVGGLLNATLGNLTELIIALAALRAGEYLLVKASLAGAIVTNVLFMMGASFLIGGARHHIQDYNLASARMQVSMLFLATFALLVPSVVGQSQAPEVTQTLSLGTSVLLIAAYVLSLVFSFGTHREFFKSAAHAHSDEKSWPLTPALITLGGTTILVALVGEVFVESVQGATKELGLSTAFVGFVVVALVSGAAEMASAFSAASKNRLDLSVSIAFGSATQIALFVAPVLVLLSYFLGPAPMSLEFWPGAILMMFMATIAASLLTAGGHSAWFVGVLMLIVYMIFALALYVLPFTA